MRTHSPTILESVLDKADKELIPLTVLLELTRDCNLNCRHCYQAGPADKTRAEMPTSSILDLITELCQAGCLFLTLSGGEPLRHPDFLEICQKANSAHMVIQVFTNGTLITESLARELALLNILDIHLSIYGARDETHDHITQQVGSYRQTLRAVSILKKVGLSVRLKYIMMKDNISDYEAMLRLGRQLDIPYDLDLVITPCDNGHNAPTKLRLPDEDLRRIYRDFLPGTAGLDSKSTADRNGSCSLGRSHCAINAWGDIYPCIQLPVSAGNIMEQSFTEIWRESPWLREIRDFSIQKVLACRECSLLAYCSQCPGLAYVESGDIYSPARESCRQAKLVRALSAD